MVAGVASAEPSVPVFVNETDTAGIQSLYKGEWEYMVGGGVAAFDCNEDLLPDLLLAGGLNEAALYANTSTNGKELTFTKMDMGVVLDKVTGAYPLDIDSDHLTDLFVLRQGENILLRGLGSCRFEHANEQWGFAGGTDWSTAFSATWQEEHNWPSLAVGNYIDRNQDMYPWGSCTDNLFYSPDESEQRFREPYPLTPSFCALSMLFTDWNNSGSADLRVSNDREYYRGGQEQMWQLNADSAPTLYQEKDGWQKLVIWGMGIASTDLNADGFPEYFLTSMADNKLQSLVVPADGKLKPEYKDIAYPLGAIAQRPYTGDEIRPSTAWHAQFGDVNNDGLNDLFIAKGNVDSMPDFAMEDPNNLLLQTRDGVFVESGDRAGVDSIYPGRGAQLIDLNMDGLLDLIVVNRNAPAEIWRNSGNAAPDTHWLKIKLRQSGVNTDAVGAKIEVRAGEIALRREVLVGGGHASGSVGFQHFGLAEEDTAQVRVTWPNGIQSVWFTVPSNGHWEIRDDGRLSNLDK